MKKIAAILLLVFTLVQAGPAVVSIFSPHVSCFIADEEKSEDKTETDKKDKKKDFATYADQATGFSSKLSIAIHLSEKILPFPCIEKVSPPPNFC